MRNKRLRSSRRLVSCTVGLAIVMAALGCTSAPQLSADQKIDLMRAEKLAQRGLQGFVD